MGVFIWETPLIGFVDFQQKLPASCLARCRWWHENWFDGVQAPSRFEHSNRGNKRLRGHLPTGLIYSKYCKYWEYSEYSKYIYPAHQSGLLHWSCRCQRLQDRPHGTDLSRVLLLVGCRGFSSVEVYPAQICLCVSEDCTEHNVLNWIVTPCKLTTSNWNYKVRMISESLWISSLMQFHRL